MEAPRGVGDRAASCGHAGAGAQSPCTPTGILDDALAAHPGEATLTGQILTVVAELVVGGLERTSASAVVADADLGWLDRTQDAVPLPPYRRLLARVLDGFGAGPILEAGTGLRNVAHPLLFVLLNSDRPEVLIHKEDRLARHIHSRHGVRIVASTDDGIVLEHFSRAREGPEPTENLASCGQHAAMLEMIGARDLTLRFPRSETPDRLAYRDGQVCEVPGRDGFDLWHFNWSAFVPSRQPMAGLDEVLLDTARLRELEERAGVTAGVERVVRGDLARTWRIDRVARELHMSKRTLQRRLAQVGRTFTELVLDIRTDEASRLLHRTELNVTAIGYMCGFADSSHFTHAFKRRFGESPGAWRMARTGQ